MKKIFFLLYIFSFFSPISGLKAAEIKRWEAIPGQSKIEFQANQDGTEINGSFKKFVAEIFFDKNNLKQSRVTITIDLNSLQSSFSDALNMLSAKEWFDLAKFPQAKFTSKNFEKISENKFRSLGSLQLKEKTLPIAFDFSFNQYSATQAQAVGSFILKRSDFGVGNKDEKLAHGVKDEVIVKFLITAK